MRDPEGIYPQMDETTRFCYRRLTAQAARNAGITEQEAACAALSQAQAGETPGERHVGAWLPSGPSYRRRGKTALLMEALFPLLVALCTAILTRAWYLVPLLYFPVWEILRYPIAVSYTHLDVYKRQIPVRRLHRRWFGSAETHRPEEIIFIVAFADVVMGSRRHINPFPGPAQCLKALDEFHMADFFAAVDQVAWD